MELQVRYLLDSKKIPKLQEVVDARRNVDSEAALEKWNKDTFPKFLFGNETIRRFDRHEVKFDLGSSAHPLQIVQVNARYHINDRNFDCDHRLLGLDLHSEGSSPIAVILAKTSLTIPGRTSLAFDKFHVEKSAAHVLIGASPDKDGRYLVAIEEMTAESNLFARMTRIAAILHFLHYGRQPREALHVEIDPKEAATSS